MLTNIKKIIKFLLITIFCFLYVFQPNLPFVSFPKHLTVISLFCLLFLFIKRGNYKNIEIKPLKYFLSFLPFLFYFYFSFILRLSISPSSIIHHNIIHISLVIIHTSIGIVFMGSLIKNDIITYKQFIHTLIIVGMIQFFFVALAFIFPQIREGFNLLTVLYSNSENNIIAQTRGDIRGFGFANSLFDSFGYRLSLLYVLSFSEYMETKKKIFLFTSLFILSMNFLNARTGVLLSMIASVIIFLFYLPHQKLIKTFKFISLTLFFLSILLFIFICFFPSKTIEWQIKGLEDTITLLFEFKCQGVYNDILGVDLKLPKDVYWGDGGIPDSFNYFGLDNGYIKEMWFFGFVGLLLFNLSIVAFFMNICFCSQTVQNKSISVSYLIIYLLFTVKLLPLALSGANFILFSFPLLAKVKSRFQK